MKGNRPVGRRRTRWGLARRPSAGALLARHVCRLGVLSETFETAITWDRFEEFHAAAMEAVRRQVAEVCGTPAEGAGRTAGQLPLHPRLPRRPGALLHGPRPRRSRRRGRAVGRDQGRRLRGGDRGRRHDHPPPRGRPRPPSLVRPPAPRALRRRPARRQARAGPRRHPQPRRPHRPGPSCNCSWA